MADGGDRRREDGGIANRTLDVEVSGDDSGLTLRQAAANQRNLVEDRIQELKRTHPDHHVDSAPRDVDPAGGGDFHHWPVEQEVAGLKVSALADKMRGNSLERDAVDARVGNAGVEPGADVDQRK